MRVVANGIIIILEIRIFADVSSPKWPEFAFEERVCSTIAPELKIQILPTIQNENVSDVVRIDG